MAIVFECSCGQVLKTDDEYAGQQVKCPGCGESVTIPAAQEEKPVCPSCGKPMDYDAIICMECGFSRKTGRQLATSGESTTGKVRVREEEIPDESPVASSFVKSFVFPLQGASLGMVIFMPVLHLLSFIPFAGVVYFALFYSCLIDIMRTAAGGPKFSVEWPNFADFWGEMLMPALIVFFASFIVIVIPLGAAMTLVGGTAALSQLSQLSDIKTQILPGLAGGSIVTMLVAIMCASYFPMTLVVSGIYRSFGASLNPITLFRLMSRIPKEYALVAPFVYIVLALPAVIGIGLALIPFGGFLLPMFQFYFWAVAASRLGFMVYYNKPRLGL